MICPVDKSDMVVVEHQKIELDYCTVCHGVWFDAGELELLLESLGVESHRQFLSNILGAPEAASKEKKHGCPICRRDLKKSQVGQKPEITVDICPRGDGIWFDGGEVGLLLGQLAEPKTGGTEADQQVVGFLKDVFRASS